MNTGAAMCAFLILQPTEGYVPQYDDFCSRNPLVCEQTEPSYSRVDMNWKTLGQISAINKFVNHSITPKTDKDIYGVDEYWTIPTVEGDCEDMALYKLLALEDKGIPRDNLVLAVVKDEHDTGHAILIIRAKQGDYVLDNKTDEIKLWSQTPYTFIMVQSYVNNKVWYTVENDCVLNRNQTITGSSK